MGNEWQQYRLGDITDWRSGGTPPKMNEKFWGGEIPWISASSMNGKRYSDSKLKVTELGLNSGTRLALTDSILLLVRGSILHQKIQVGIAEKDVSFNQDVKAITVKDDFIEPWYLLFWFMAKEQELLGLVENTGIGAGKLDTKILQNLIIDVPPVGERKRILTFAKSIEDKIENNRQTIQTLEQMAQALFKSWFVDFDPVIDNTIAAKNSIPEPFMARKEQRLQVLAQNQKKDRGANISSDEYRTLFPCELELTEDLGWVPKGWGVKQIKDFGSIICGKTPSKKDPDNFDGNIPFIKIPDMHGKVYPIRTADTLSEQGANTQLKKEIPAGSVCVSSIATVGKVVIAPFVSHTNQQINTIVPFSLKLTPYIYLSMLELEKVFHDLGSGGSATLNMNTSVFSKIKLLMPSEKALSKFHSQVEGYFSKILSLEESNLALVSLRDSLLPKLIFGELHIPEAQQQLSTALA